MKANRRITPAGGGCWTTFTFEEQLRSQAALPKSYSRELPRLQNGPSAGLPECMTLRWDNLPCDGRVDPEPKQLCGSLSDRTVETGRALAILIMVRLALIENLRRIGLRVDITDRNRADYWADRMLEIV